MPLKYTGGMDLLYDNVTNQVCITKLYKKFLNLGTTLNLTATGTMLILCIFLSLLQLINLIILENGMELFLKCP